MGTVQVKVIEPHISRQVQCPDCGIWHPFKKAKEHWRTVKAPSLTRPVLLRVRMVYSKCLNPRCPRRIFALPVPGIERYQRATTALIQEGVSGLVEDSTTLQRIANRLSRSLNTSGSKSALARWKHRCARQYAVPEILHQLGFSGALCLDEFMPRRGGRYEQIAGDAKRIRILALEPVPAFYGRGVTEAFCRRLDGWGIHPSCVIFDLLTTFPKFVARVWPQAYQQFDHFHVMQWLWHYLRNALIQFRKSLQGPRWALHREELWELKWGLLKPMDRWGPKERLLIPEMMELYAGTVVEQVLLFKEALWDIFEVSRSKADAYAKRDALTQEVWWRASWHLSKSVEFLRSPKFDRMVTYLDHPEVPRCGHSETLINVWRQLEAVRRGFKSAQGRLDHLKLFQVTHYLRAQNLP